jgi:hypothetical protein
MLTGMLKTASLSGVPLTIATQIELMANTVLQIGE